MRCMYSTVTMCHIFKVAKRVNLKVLIIRVELSWLSLRSPETQGPGFGICWLNSAGRKPLPRVLVRWTWTNPFIYFFKSLLIDWLIDWFFRERGREGEREGGKHQSVLSPVSPNLGMCPDRELNRWPFALQDDTKPTVLITKSIPF